MLSCAHKLLVHLSSDHQTIKQLATIKKKIAHSTTALVWLRPHNSNNYKLHRCKIQSPNTYYLVTAVQNGVEITYISNRDDLNEDFKIVAASSAVTVTTKLHNLQSVIRPSGGCHVTSSGKL